MGPSAPGPGGDPGIPLPRNASADSGSGSGPGGEGEDGEPAYVRPYTVTGGRTRPSGLVLPFEALVEGLAGPRSEHAAESRRILGLVTGRYLSVAELSAHLHLPVGVVRVLVGDLADEGCVRVHGLTTTVSAPAPATTLSVLESVLDGISAL